MSEPPPEHRLFRRPVPGEDQPPPPPAPPNETQPDPQSDPRPDPRPAPRPVPQTEAPPGSPPVVLGATPGAEVVEQGQGVLDDRSRGRWWLVAGALGLVLVGGGIAAYLLLGAESARTSDGLVLPEAMVAEPEVAWTWSGSDGPVRNLGAAGDRVFAVDDDGVLVALDRDGEELWTRDDERTSFVFGVPGVDDLVLVEDVEGGGLSALSADDGEERWQIEDAAYPLFFQDGGLLVNLGDGQGSDPVGWIDLRNGRERWRTEAEFAGLGDGAVYVVSEGELRKVDIDSGKEQWSVEAPIDADSFANVAVADGLVAVSRGDEATAYDTGSGEELWSVSAEGDNRAMSVGVFDEQRVYVSETTYVGREDEDDDGPATTVTIRSRGEDVQELDVDQNGFFFGGALRDADGRSWFLDYAGGALFDQTLERVADYGGDLTLLDRGVYERDESGLSYFRYGDEEPTWELALAQADDEESVLTGAVDGGFMLAADGDLTMYR